MVPCFTFVVLTSLLLIFTTLQTQHWIFIYGIFMFKVLKDMEVERSNSLLGSDYLILEVCTIG